MINWTKAIASLLVIAFLLPANSQTADDDEVVVGIPGYNHRFFSGYLPLDVRTNPKLIHYVFYHSQNNVSGDPLVIWFSGSPGCSALLASFHQNGPFIIPQGRHNIVVNQKAWNKNANLLYLELPANTGFSVGPDQQNITDQSFTHDAMGAVGVFLSRFPGMKKNQMYLAGHGYGAVHISYLAERIIRENNDEYALIKNGFNLKGILLGNPCVRRDECYATGSQKSSYYHYQFLNNRGFFTKADWNSFRGLCIMNYDGYNCYTQRIKMDKIFNETNTSRYNIYDKCYKGQNDSSNYMNTGCEDNAGLITFLNDPNVQDNWNIQPNSTWQPCSNKVHIQYKGGNNSYWLLPYLIDNKLRIWAYSGDIDSFIPTSGTKKWIEDLRHQRNMPVKRVWREWWVPGSHKGEDQVGGFIWELRDLTFVTVKGGGFRTGLDQPQAMSEVLDGFLAGKTLPYKNV